MKEELVEETVYVAGEKAEEGTRKEGQEVEQEQREMVEETVCVEGEKAEEGIRKEGQEVEQSRGKWWRRQCVLRVRKLKKV